ncbi:hypothetical protein BRADI_1g34225v3 [Brachypodium distachyon]|uniref:Uncharacterized protein n=1 Tax=Brachypodium distachyon TaxID=15368 RepID=A0A0Q3JI45_BRADI|nr:hypothetical protein BRADI_1g34225v3 [Brachypodium distachyon]
MVFRHVAPTSQAPRQRQDPPFRHPAVINHPRAASQHLPSCLKKEAATAGDLRRRPMVLLHPRTCSNERPELLLVSQPRHAPSLPRVGFLSRLRRSSTAFASSPPVAPVSHSRAREHCATSLSLQADHRRLPPPHRRGTTLAPDSPHRRLPFHRDGAHTKGSLVRLAVHRGAAVAAIFSAPGDGLPRSRGMLWPRDGECDGGVPDGLVLVMMWREIAATLPISLSHPNTLLSPKLLLSASPAPVPPLAPPSLEDEGHSGRPGPRRLRIRPSLPPPSPDPASLTRPPRPPPPPDPASLGPPVANPVRDPPESRRHRRRTRLRRAVQHRCMVQDELTGGVDGSVRRRVSAHPSRIRTASGFGLQCGPGGHFNFFFCKNISLSGVVCDRY